MLRKKVNKKIEVKTYDHKGAKNKIINIPAKFIESDRKESKVIVRWGEVSVTNTGIVKIDPITGEIDFMKVIETKVPYSIDQLIFLDGEIFSKGEPLDREIYVFELDQNEKGLQLGTIYGRFKSGIRLELDGRIVDFSMTPPLKAIIKYLKDY